MPRTRTGTKTVVCREAIVINVGGRPVKYGRQMVTDRRTGERVEIDYTDSDYENHRDYDPGNEGTPYVFKAGERVHSSHPAVEANPAAFMSVEEADEVFDSVS
jgi:hypothetical protein